MYLIDAVAEPNGLLRQDHVRVRRGDGPDLPPGYVVEYRKPPFVEGINTTTEGFKDAKAYLYVELQPTATVDRRFAGSGRTTYRGNQRLALDGMEHTVIVEWLKDYEDSDAGGRRPTTRSSGSSGSTEKRPFTVDSVGAAGVPARVSVIVMR